MALTTRYSQKFKEALISGQVNFGTIGTGQGSPHSFKIILMNNSFTFNEDNHGLYANVSSSELATAYGYTQATKSLGTLTVARNDTDNSINVTYNPVSWTAVNGNIGPSNGAIIYDDTHADDLIIGYIDFGGPQTTYDGGVFSISLGTLKFVQG
jgi:hypothetical protein